MLGNNEKAHYAIFIIFVLLILSAVLYMNSSSLEVLGFFGFILVLGIIIFLDRKSVTFSSFVFMRRTVRVNRFIDNLTKKHRGFWSFMSKVGVVVAIPCLVIISVFLIFTAYDIAQGGAQAGGAGIVLPGPVSSPQAVPGAFILPWWIWVIGVITVMLPHEFFHGIMFRVEKIRLKSVGWILFLILPGAFAEPDEAQLKKAKRSTKLKAYAAGSFANLLVAFIIIIILSVTVAFVHTSEPGGVLFQTVEGSPLENNSIIGGVLVSIDGMSVSDREDVVLALEGKHPGDVVRIQVLSNSSAKRVLFTGKFNFVLPEPSMTANFDNIETYDIVLDDHPDKNLTGKGFLGVAPVLTVNKETDPMGLEIINVVVWMYVFSFGIGLINLLPIKPLDGGLIFEEIVGSEKKYIVRAVSVFMLLILLFNIFGAFII
jgi:membrane-associated protease RseP (regulator of RpoE activity)